ncbi:MAG TPA: hypothetical protein VFT22_11470 [Kofleriaceae bacterium]|nr:hypothetical protein [Kofleriaceae bacterium]
MRSGSAVAGLWALAGSACHVVVESDTTRPALTETIVHPEGATARRPALVLTEQGRLRFVEPLECPTEELVRPHTTTEVTTRPNLATFTVGVVALAVGGVMLTGGVFSSRPGDNPYTYAGLAGLGAGLPLSIGPWIGNRTQLREPREPAASGVVRRPGPSGPCGARPLPRGAATLEVDGIEVHGTIDGDGMFSSSPYDWIDAYGAASAVSSVISAQVEVGGGPRTITAVLDARELARHAGDFLARADFDPRVEPLERVPGIVAGPVRANLATTERGPELRVAVTLRNDGPGDAWGLRGQIAAPGAPAIDGRMIYVGKLARGSAVTREIAIPLAPAAAAALAGAAIDLSIELRDAHGTAPTTPVRLRGALGGGPPHPSR